MIKAFVFGKFLPFHKGHEAMIHFALGKCDFLTVLICCSDKENIPDIVRSSWIEKTFAHQKNFEVKTLNYLESEYPNTSQSSKGVAQIWANVFKKLFPDYSLLITSEEYGDFVAGFMNIQHIAFDIPKNKFPVSATAVRKDLLTNWHFLPDSVKPYFVVKVVISGTESTGKSTLAEKLSTYFNCGLVSEAARDIIADSNTFSFDDLSLVATEHAKRIDQTILGKYPLIIIDTDIHTTKSYAKFALKKELEISDDIYNSNKATLYLYFNNDVEFIQDGSRLNKVERDLLDLSHRLVFTNHQIQLVEITGNWDERFQKSVEQIKSLLNGINN